MIRRCLSILRLALPVLVSQVGLILVNFADNIMVGRYSTEALASASFVINLFNIPMLCAMGFSYGLTPLIGLLFSQGKSTRIGQTLRAGVIANLLAGIILTAIMACLYRYIPQMGQPEELLPYIRPYYLIFLSSLLPMTLFNAFAQWSYAVRNTSMPMWILLACNMGNILGNYILIFGNMGAPELGLDSGCTHRCPSGNIGYFYERQSRYPIQGCVSASSGKEPYFKGYQKCRDHFVASCVADDI